MMSGPAIIALISSIRALLQIAAQSDQGGALRHGTELAELIDRLINGAGQATGVDEDVRRYQRLLLEDLERVAGKGRSDHERLKDVADRLRGQASGGFDQ